MTPKLVIYYWLYGSYLCHMVLYYTVTIYYLILTYLVCHMGDFNET